MHEVVNGTKAESQTLICAPKVLDVDIRGWSF